MAKSLSSKMNSMKQKESAKKNTTITKKVGHEEPTVVKAGTPLDHSAKHAPQECCKSNTSSPKVGASIGCTLNMENYESMRIDCWLTDDVKDGETFEEAFARVLEVVQNQVEEVASQYKVN